MFAQYKIVCFITVLVSVIPAILCAAQSPRQLSNDPRIQVVSYQENNVVSLNTSVFINTQIVFGASESILDVENGDSSAWTYHVNPDIPYILTLKPIIMGSNTDLSVITTDTSKQIRFYHFHITSADKPISTVEDQVYAIQFIYPDDVAHLSLKANSAISGIPVHYHWRYSYHGDAAIKPKSVYDDGEFTYLVFPDNVSLPAVFSVDNAEGEESSVNVRREGRQLVIQQVSPQFTLRSGEHHVGSIFNNSMIYALTQRESS